ncbi:MAG TPA: ATP-binding cassette domain-containing protein [Acidimicrobiales bacterium]|nr:ATP-binding cassette domain-containing protein [Acidimicrobiales bacterium]
MTVAAPRRTRPRAVPDRPSAALPREPLLAVRHVSKGFGGVPVLTDVSLRVDAGQVVALVGDNGAGKSTLGRCIGGALHPDAGDVLVRGVPVAHGVDDARRAGVEVVWQDVELCDNLDTVANLFLGREHRRGLAPAHRHREARAALDRLGIDVGDLRRPVATLSGGQRQAIAVARALAADPALLVLDEPTAALGRTEAAKVLEAVRERRDLGTGVLLVTHQLDHVFDAADRIVVLRQGRVVADVSPLEVHPDDVVALQAGIEIESTASRQLRRLGSLVGQMSAAAPTTSLPLVVAALAAALGQGSLCVHLLDPPGGRRLRRTAAVGLPPGLAAATASLPTGAAGGPVGVAAATAATVVTEDVRTDPTWAPLAGVAAATGVLSSWATPIVGGDGVLGTISGYGGTVGRPRADQLELIGLYAAHAAASIERERLLDEARRRNRVLETIRAVLEVLAGPEQVPTGLDPALAALCAALGAGGAVVRRATADDAPPATLGQATLGTAPVEDLLAAADGALRRQRPHVVAVSAGRVHAVPFDAPDGRAALAAWWADSDEGAATEDVLHDVTRSLRLALERAGLERAHQESEALRRSQRLQRSFLSRLSHELRTPLTAVHGCVDTLLQPDVEWDRATQDRFLGTIAAESDRMRRLVVDLLDASAIEAGIFQVHPDWCDLRLVLDASVACAVGAGGDAGRVVVRVAPGLGPVWADHDRLEQVLVNLLDNALRHTPPGTPVDVTAGPAAGDGVVVRVRDDGPGVPADVASAVFEPHTTGAPTGGHGLGLAIARGIARAHGGSLALDPPVGGRGASFTLTLPGHDG